ncbi:hypothetical protein E6P09_08390 [Haloferax mediterranei ATCC 33500]|uniref:Uncharacterized protein n=1 Tax=Haloferax mediterranei (strain ATCC 33500 / DSM 1411 / JCM 8866 / NBRC 14739 / NCIMB 2177 / R-4) TaxID=523841 RepID=I3R3H8_HALMT|nr:hypothetical protein [Haloferax mediterranei]AFK18788.2 hypothetical protein HFX_1072 [Haloferax mediterranei ATCC 33500]AHZ21844.1 hypothetical protein BM92_03850 [Haloferax mediterranei ATCC 33500]EMA03353.1 hypothetical protein C439_05125 [Haloferax mediterranei ATCC 33500]MDX5988883.1 hypothetical protein [Haloferax mediterranei ATCC 33500]QCQ76624.1 hypothetical protein E6P09_08390 [Haloferax mediterranei ATCC 33500]
MASVNGPGPDSDVAMDAIRETAEGAVSLVAVYGATAFDLFHVGETVREAFGSRDELVAHLSSLAEETRREFMERGLFSGLSPVQNSVEYRFEERDDYGVLQVYCGGRGMLLFVEPDEPVEPLVRTASQLLGGM